MTVAKLAVSTTTTSLAASSTAAAATPVARQMAKADARIQSQLDVANAQISSFGQLKSTLSDVQLAGRALSALGKNSTAADAKSAASQFITTFNASLAAAKSAATASSASPQEMGSATRVKTDLTRSVASDSSTVDALKKIGITQAADGSLSLDAKKWDAAAQASPAALLPALATVGQSVDKTSAKELASDGKLAGSMALLTQRATTVKSYQTAMLAMEQRIAASQAATSSTTSSTTYSSGLGLAAYLANN